MAESNVIDAVWQEVGGELVQEFVVPTIPGQPSRVRRIDAVFAVDGPRRQHPDGTPLDLRGRNVVVCQAKSGQLDLGVLGQTLFSAELVQQVHGPRSLRLIAAAVEPNPLIERLLESYRPLGWRIEHRQYPSLPLGTSSGARASSAMRQEMVAAVHNEVGGFLMKVGNRRSQTDFANVRVASSGEPLRPADPDALILPARPHGEALARSAAEIAANEPVILVHTCEELYMTPAGRAVFGGEIARGLLELANVTSVLRYRQDNAVLRKMIGQLPSIVVLPG